MLTMRIVVLYCLLSFSSVSFAQNHFLGVKGGISWTDITAKDFTIDRNFRTGTTFGLTYDVRVQKNTHYGVELIYNQRGFTSDLNSNLIYGGIEGMKGKLIFNYNYISLPIKVGFDYGEKLYGFTNFCLAPSFLTVARQSLLTVTTDNIVVPGELSKITSIVNRLDLAFILELGGGYKFSRNSLVFASFSFLHSLNSITNKFYFENTNIKHYGFIFNIGFKFALKKD